MKRIKFFEDLKYFAKNPEEKKMMLAATGNSIDNMQSLIGDKGGRAKLQLSGDLIKGKNNLLLNNTIKIFSAKK
jgi:hypothetical protein